MLRNEDRLYHVIVSFPSICANQFLVLKCKYFLFFIFLLIFFIVIQKLNTEAFEKKLI